LLTDDLEQKCTVQIHGRKLRDPGVRIKVRAGIYQPGNDGVNLAEVGTRLLKRCGAANSFHDGYSSANPLIW
jgi:hypothetical protein